MATSTLLRKRSSSSSDQKMSSVETQHNYPSRSSHHFNRWFSSRDQIEKFRPYESLHVIKSHWIHHEFFQNLDLECMDWLQENSLTQFLTIRENVYPELVRIFYSNLSFRKGCICSEVKGTPIIISPTLWAKLTGLKSSGSLYDTDQALPVSPEWQRTFSEAAARDAIFHVQSSILKKEGQTYLYCGNLTPSCRILHFFLVKILIPRDRDVSALLPEDYVALWPFVKRMPIDWSWYVIHHMLKSHYEKTSLPYAMLITRILKYFNVPLQGEVKILLKSAYNRIGENHMESWQLTHKNGSWVHKVFGIASTQTREQFPDLAKMKDASDAEALVKPPNPAPQPPHPAPISPHLLEILKAHFDQKFADLQAYLESKFTLALYHNNGAYSNHPPTRPSTSYPSMFDFMMDEGELSSFPTYMERIN